MTIAFSATAIPVQTRNAEPNPFTEVAAHCAANPTEAVTFSLPLVAGDEAASKKIIEKAKRQLSQVGGSHNVTLRSTFTVAGTAKAPVANVTVWAVARITKARKDASAPAE